MRKLVSTFMVAIAMVAMINPLSAEGCNPNGNPISYEVGTCVTIPNPGGPDIQYCDTALGDPMDLSRCWVKIDRL